MSSVSIERKEEERHLKCQHKKRKKRVVPVKIEFGRRFIARDPIDSMQQLVVRKKRGGGRSEAEVQEKDYYLFT